MSLLAFGLIIISACMHATWNYLAKRSKGGTAFVWLYTAVSAIIYAPFVTFVLIYQEINIGWIGIGMIAGSAVIHLVYSLTLQKGYSIGDFSLIYPIARGTGPMLVAISAVFLYDERLTPLGITGIALIVLSVFIITGGLHIFTQSNAIIPLAYGALVGVMIAGYTLLDKGAVDVFLVPPLLLNYGSIIGQLLLLSPIAKRNWKAVRSDWKQHRKEAIGVGILNPLAYILILTTMVFTPVSHVAPVRELSILFGAIMGTVLLSEGFGKRRIIAAGIMVVGIIAVALS
ncbi:drug/metabolite transporter (DMT)-like permease [Virgibacillus halotolerans]|uniref:EamA family transporter n=1 Tax=Virgibacillus halotolerans TaxID=1071053 RepID=UPI001961779A|nr:EamA family transporter [Virgibacillus halotolerans]MBM7600019.1 drug/metabolite transporter (DMT)-like permease [Virgibacillus halotolerans]